MAAQTLTIQNKNLPWWTWVLPGVVCHIGTQISLLTPVAPGVSAVYLPIPFALVMSFWWGPRVLLGVYINAVLSAGLWELPEWKLWPLYAMPETVAVFAGWWLFSIAGKGRCWLPNLSHVVKFILLAVFPAAALNAFYVAGQLVLLGDLAADEFWQASWSGGIATLLDGLAIAAPLAFFLTPVLERRGLTRTEGASLDPFAEMYNLRPAALLEIAAVFAGMLVLSRLIALERYWSVCGVFVLWAALRFGIGMAVCANLWLEFAIMILPVVLRGDARVDQMPSLELQNLQTALAMQCLAGMVAGRMIDDLRIEIARRAKSDAELRESEERFRTLVEHATEGIFIANSQGKYLDVNTAGCQMLQYTKEEIRGFSIGDIVVPEELERIAPELERLMQGHAVRNAWRFRRKDGSIFHGEVSARQLPDGRLLGVVRDMSDHRAALEALAEKESLLRQFIRHTPAAIAMLDGDLRYIQASERWIKDYHLEGKDIIGRSHYEVFPDIPERWKQVHKRVLAGSVEYCDEDPFPRKDGKLEWLQWEARPWRKVGGEIGGLIFFTQVITGRIESEAFLKTSEARHRAILDSSLDGLIVINGGGQVLEFNPAAEAIFGYTRAEIFGKNMAELIIPPNLREAHTKGIERYLATGESRILGKRLEMPAMRKDGDEVRVELSIQPVAGASPPLFAGVVRDITERLRLEEQLRQAQKMESIGRLAGGVAHDFNNLLTGIMGYAEMTLMDDVEHPRRKHIEEIQKISLRAGQLTRQLLAFSRQQVVAPQVLDLNAVVSEMQKMLVRIIGEGIELNYTLHPESLKTIADRGQLEQVLLNLVVNSRDATTGTGKIVVETYPESVEETYRHSGFAALPGEYVVLCVKDSGEGMPPSIIEHIFEPYFTTKALGKGTGLGLSMVFGIVKKANGFICVESEPGKGSCFRVYLPSSGQGSAPRTREMAGSVSSRGEETIFIVEDEATILEIASAGLRALGYTIVTANHPRQALETFKAYDGPIHLVLSDVVLPEMSGPNLLGVFRTQRPDLKVLFMSGYTEDETLLAGIKDRSVDFIEKPFKIQDLGIKVRQVLDK